MSDRCTLHLSKLDAFAAYQAAFGWVRADTKGECEVLRLTHPQQRHPFLAYARDSATEHATIPDTPDRSRRNHRMVAAFIRASRREVSRG